MSPGSQVTPDGSGADPSGHEWGAAPASGWSRRLRSPTIPLASLALLLAVLPFLLRLPLVRTRGFNPDELEHLHFGWCVSRGMLPYVDYFEHHTPWLHYGLAPLLARYDTDIDEDEAQEALFAARRAMLPWAAATLLLAALLARRHAGAAAGWVAPVLLTHFAYFLSKSLEVRPDVPAAALLTGGVLLLRGPRPAWGDPRPGAFFASGLAFGAATLLTQKVLFALAGVAAAELMILALARARRRERLVEVAAQALGFAVPWASTLGYFAGRGGLGAFFDLNFAVNTRWPGPGPEGFLTEFVREDPALVLVSAAGLAAALVRLARGRGRPEGELVLAAAALALAVSLAALPAVTRHYFLLLLPLLAVLGAGLLVRLAARVPLPAPAAHWILAVLIALACAEPLGRLRDAFDRGNWSTLQGVRWVVRNVGPSETTLDGYTGLGVFRPQAFFHQFFYADPMAVQTEAEQRDVLESLRSGRALPKVAFLNWRLRSGVRPEVIAFLDRHYARLGPEPIHVRVFDNGLGFWSDEGPRPFGFAEGAERAPHVYFEGGWRSPARLDGVGVRQTRTDRSAIVLPIRHARDYVATLRARAAADVPAFDFELVVNNVSAGTSAASARWEDHVFPLPGRHLIPGFNAVELRFHQPRGAAPGRAELAIQHLALRRR